MPRRRTTIKTPPTYELRPSVAGMAASQRSLPPWLIPLVGLLIVVLLFALVIRGCSASGDDAASNQAAEQASQQELSQNDAAQSAVSADAVAGTVASRGATSSVETVLLDEGRTTASGAGRMSFSAVGDNLMNENLLTLADGWAGSTGDGAYDFSPFYTEVSAYIQNNIDVSFINQETVLGSNDNYVYQGYPSYNTPDSLATAVADAGWRVVNFNSNHSYDIWTSALEHAQSVWNDCPSLLLVGSYESEADRAKVRVVECNGLRVAVLSYSYGQNGYDESDLPNDYYAVPYDEERMQAEVDNAQQVADAVVVYVHDGTEYDNDPSSEQVEIAKACAASNVDVTLFSHSHVIEPVAWIDRADGESMLCAYGLGDFVSGYENNPDTIMSGMLTFDFVARDDGGVSVENAVWHALVEHMEGSTDVVRFVSGYTQEEAERNELLSSLDDPYNWLVEQTKTVVGSDVEIDS